MNGLLNETGVALKGVGDGLKANDINAINNTVNKEVAVINDILCTICNVNKELGDYSRQFTLPIAIALVPEERRTPGMSVRFLNMQGRFVEYIYCGEDAENWMITDNWKPFVSRVDGGEW